MECLFFISFSSSILLACYDGTSYLDETLHCNMYGWNNVYVQLAMYEWMKVMCWICDIYLLSYIFAVKIVGLKKIEKRANMQALCRLPPTAMASLPTSRGRQMRHVAANCASWELTHLVSLPKVADDKGRKNFAISGGRQRQDEFCHQRRMAQSCC